MVPPVKALIDDQLHNLHGLGPKDSPPSYFGLFVNGAAKLLNKS